MSFAREIRAMTRTAAGRGGAALNLGLLLTRP